MLFLGIRQDLLQRDKSLAYQSVLQKLTGFRVGGFDHEYKSPDVLEKFALISEILLSPSGLEISTFFDVSADRAGYWFYCYVFIL